MSPRFRFLGISLPKTSHFKLLTITATVILAVAAVVVSVHSSNQPASTAEKTAANSGKNPRGPGQLKTGHTVAGRNLAPAPLAPTVTASKADSLFTDVDGDLQADPGDTLKYTVNIGSSGEDATGVTFTDTVDPNTAFVPGSLTATPVAVDDSYAATGNIRISVAAPGVLGNDFTGVPAATITAPPSTSANGGDVTLNADGSFTYNPPAGFEGADTFTYTLTNATGSNSATVTVNVSGMIWFIDNNASCPCDGRLTNPFNTLASFAAVNNGTGNNPAANDNIFVYESATDYVGPVTLLNGQRFIGQDATASLSAITGLTPPAGSDPLPTTNSANGTIVNITTGNAITVASGNTLTGFTGGDSTTDISGTGFGTLTISDVTLNGTGQALNLTTGTLTATFGSISSTNSGTTGISLTSVAGSLTSPTTTIANPAGIGLSVDTSSGSLNFGNTTSSSSGGTGVSLLTNSGAITFGSLDISPDANQRGLLATDNSNTITSTSGAISAGNAIAVEITRASGTTPLSMSLTSVSANGGANGIVITNTSGFFTVNGSGTTDGSGGTVQNITTRGASFNNAANITLKNMNFTNANSTVDGGGAGVCDDLNLAGCNAAIYLSGVAGATLDNLNVTGTMVEDGITALNVSNFKLDNSLLDGCGDATNESCVEAQNLSGTSTVNGTEIRFSESNSFDVVNTDVNWNLEINGSTFRDTQTTSSGGPVNTNGEGGLQFRSFSSAAGAPTTTINVLNSSFLRLRTQGIQAFAADDTVLNIDITGSTIDAQADIGTAIDINSNNTAQVNFNITGNPTIQSRGGAAVNVTSFLASTMEGRINNNSDIEVLGGAGIAVRLDGENTSQMIVEINGNTVSNVNGTESTVIDVTSRFQTARVDATITNNTVSVRPAGIAAINLTSGASAAGESAILCGDVANNNAANAAVVAARAFRIRVSDVSNLNRMFLEGFVEAGTALQDTEATWNTRGNTPLSVAGNEVAASLTGTAVGPLAPPGGVCNAVDTPSDFAPNESLDPSESAPGMQRGSTESNFARQTDPTESAPVMQSDSERDTANVLEAFQGEAKDRENLARLSPSHLNLITQAAIERWRARGLSYEELARLQAMTFEIEDLPGGQLATATATSVKIDDTAAGYGWYLDPAPMEDSEFDVPVPGRELQSTEYSAAFGRMDLLTVVMRQLGVAFRQGKDRLPKQLRPLMEGTLSPAVRRLPDSRNIQLPSSRVRASGKNQADSKTSAISQIRKGSVRRSKSGVSKSPASAKSPTSVSEVAFNRSAKPFADRNSRLMHHAPRIRTAAPALSSMLADVMLNIGTLPAGKSVTITFNVTVDDPFGGALPQVSNQGTVSGTNFADVLTDDPSVGGAADPTVTPIDLPQVSLAVSPASVLEDGATNLVYTFTRTGSTANAMTVNFSVAGTASFTEPDYTQTGAATFTATSGTVVIPGGSSTATVTVDPSVDLTVEPDETVLLTVTSGIGYTVGSPSTASGTITNDDTDVSVAVSPSSVAEDGASNLVYTFTRVGDTTSSLTVNFSIATGGSNAVFPADYTQTGAATFVPPVGTVTFGAGNSTATVTVDPAADALVEPDETVIFTVTSGAGYNVGSPASATGTITNDDAEVSVTVAPSSASEDGATNLVYTFTRTGFTVLPATVNFSVAGSAVFSSGDYTQTGAATYSDASGTVVFGAGDTTATVTIDPSADSTVEPDETVILTVTSGVGYNVGSPSSATGTITNDDTDVSVAVSPGSVAEDGATNLVYTFTRAGVTTTSLTVSFSVGGTAVFGPSPDDYTQTGATTFTTTSGSVTFGAGNSTATVTVNPETDSTVEPDETVNLAVTAGAGYNVGSPSSASGTITNDDTDVSVAVAPASVAEDGATNLVYTFTRNGVTSGALTVNFSVGGTADFGASPNDYTQTGATTYTATTGSVTFGAGNSTATVTVNPETDTTIEADETVILSLTSGAGYNVSSPSSATGTITNDDADVSVAVAPAAVAEDGATNLVYTFTRTGFTAGSLTVNFSVGGTATFGVSPDDYTQTGATTFTTNTGSVTFSAGSPTATVTVDPETDTTAESDETVVITLTAGASYNAVSPSSATGTILNDDTLVSVAVAPSSTAEGGANLVYTFTRTGPTTSAVTANFSVGGSASFPADYTQSGATTFTPPTATVTFGVGNSTATVTVTPLTDCTVEGSETVEFTVQPGAGYGVGSPSMATGTITNTPDSSAPTITLIPNVNMTLWPPNHSYESVAVTDFVASASDNCDASVNLNSVYIQKITSDEAENGNGDGNTLNDIVIAAGCKTAQLRSERDGSADGRVYTITFKVKDSAGNFSTATAKATVRKSPNQPAVDSGTAYTVNSTCP